MNIFQCIVVPLAIALAVTALVTWLRGGGRIGILKSAIWFCFAAAVYKPGLVQYIANLANIGHGADLLLYGLAVFVLMMTFHILKQLETQRGQLTMLVRELAISRPEWPDNSNDQP